MCLGCSKSEVSATITGRIDAVQPALRRDAAGKIIEITGFGNLNAYPVRLVLQSVSDVASHEIDYTKVAAITKAESNSDSSGGDATSAVHGIAKVFGAGNHPASDQVERAAAAFSKQGDPNGVNVGFSGMNEASLRIEQKSAHASPDGVIYNCTSIRKTASKKMRSHLQSRNASAPASFGGRRWGSGRRRQQQKRRRRSARARGGGGGGGGAREAARRRRRRRGGEGEGGGVCGVSRQKSFKLNNSKCYRRSVR